MAGGSAELELFRRRWREELAGGGKRRRREEAEPGGGEPREAGEPKEPGEPGYLVLARGLLDGGEAPARCRSSPPAGRPAEEAAGDGGGDGDDLLGQLIRDLVGRGEPGLRGGGGGRAPGGTPERPPVWGRPLKGLALSPPEFAFQPLRRYRGLLFV